MHKFPRDKVDVEAEERKRVRVVSVVLVQVFGCLALGSCGRRFTKAVYSQRGWRLSCRRAHKFVHRRMQWKANVAEFFFRRMVHVVGRRQPKAVMQSHDEQVQDTEQDAAKRPRDDSELHLPRHLAPNVDLPVGLFLEPSLQLNPERSPAS
ncbi:hypothetical protein H310_01052 [Aphanomyces invadans]|uniref:Uncharacterized protein n=1 Tax=Aphanomyces invadans TaxID=157072 RepID=A0A024UQC8_9STRA|nr:hypothetical protein H310_01052 [Aphanomyces invadans]ETW08479.1 hypothetical protein H310_01052 [Aphanomyces invadans]|eukprot:XP_008862284.1 hypothetical protein H310_01052 [Aphanomyces invadans]